VAELRPYHLHDDLSLSPAYVPRYAFHALGKVNGTTAADGRRGARALLTELIATMKALRLEESLAAAEPLRAERQALSRARAPIGAASAAQLLAAIAIVEEAVRSELQVGGAGVRTAESPSSLSLRLLLGEVALARCPEALRGELIDACRALDYRLFTAAVFHFHRAREQLPGPAEPAADGQGVTVKDPRIDMAVRCSRADAVGFLSALRVRIEQRPDGPHVNSNS
jgi:hypothetical protein